MDLLADTIILKDLFLAPLMLSACAMLIASSWHLGGL